MYCVMNSEKYEDNLNFMIENKAILFKTFGKEEKLKEFLIKNRIFLDKKSDKLCRDLSSLLIFLVNNGFDLDDNLHRLLLGLLSYFGTMSIFDKYKNFHGIIQKELITLKNEIY